MPSLGHGPTPEGMACSGLENEKNSVVYWLGSENWPSHCGEFGLWKKVRGGQLPWKPASPEKKGEHIGRTYGPASDHWACKLAEGSPTAFSTDVDTGHIQMVDPFGVWPLFDLKITPLYLGTCRISCPPPKQARDKARKPQNDETVKNQ